MRQQWRVDVSFMTFLRGLAVVALAWAWLRLWQWALVLVLGAFLAVALDPGVQWLEKRGIRRSYGAPLIALALVLIMAAFIGFSGASLVREARLVGEEVVQFRETLMTRIPPTVREAGASLAPSGESLTRAGNALAGGIGGVGVAFVVTIYLLLDGRRTYAWLVAFVPAPARPRMHETGECARTVVAAYVRGNVITSVLATVATWIALAIMQVPAAFVLAVFAGLMNFVPVVGMLISAAPAILLGLAKSPAVALGVAAFFALYNLVENYYIQPAVYGRELRLSALAVIVAFLVGAQLGGVLGALISLPMAAMYPCIERIWFSRSAQAETADEHRRIEAQPEH